MLDVYNNNTDQEYQLIINPVEIEIQFISATRHDEKNDRSLGRGEFLELIVRIANIKYRQVCKDLLRNKMARNVSRKVSIKKRQSSFKIRR